jgi:hypothetical protein
MPGLYFFPTFHHPDRRVPHEIGASAPQNLVGFLLARLALSICASEEVESMHGHIAYVSQKLLEFSSVQMNEEIASSLRSMRTMLIGGLEIAADHRERSTRLSLVRKIDLYLREEWRDAS